MQAKKTAKDKIKTLRDQALLLRASAATIRSNAPETARLKEVRAAEIDKEIINLKRKFEART